MAFLIKDELGNKEIVLNERLKNQIELSKQLSGLAFATIDSDTGITHNYDRKGNITGYKNGVRIY